MIISTISRIVTCKSIIINYALVIYIYKKQKIRGNTCLTRMALKL